ncbi:MAG: chlororespiratory reduction 6 domain-containing protein, partial [Microcoleaceae cyanobacterium]
MTITINLNADHIHNLDLSPLQTVITQILADGARAIALAEQKLMFQIDYPQEEFDPRELSEISEIRLWFIQADACHPWLP